MKKMKHIYINCAIDVKYINIILMLNINRYKSMFIRGEKKLNQRGTNLLYWLFSGIDIIFHMCLFVY